MRTDLRTPRVFNPLVREGPSEQELEWLEILDRELHKVWALGRNLILVWTAKGRGMEVLVIPHYTISEHAATAADDVEAAGQSALGLKPRSFIEEVIANPKQVTKEGLGSLSKMTGYDPVEIELPFVPEMDLHPDLIESVVQRYSISYVDDRAVALFDIVGFSLYSPLEQVTQLNSLSYSVNSAYSKMLSKKIDISFARTTTGDGYYVWNRDRSVQANVNLYHFMHLVLADNALARAKSSHNTTPLLRACFHMGGHYEFYQSEGLSPTVYSYIVGDVTIELARMIDRALPGQILVGDFDAPMPDRASLHAQRINAVDFIERTQSTLSSLEGLTLSGDHITDIKCYLTGEKRDDDFAIKRYSIADKHGRSRNVYNAKVNIYRKNAEPVFLGVQESDLGDFRREDEEFV
ncbi:MAG: hypothetical protein HOH04_08530 [Rhodospirillaceae bacterium]|nr:hypothetical protein [Rhodospirillaceae bacterium]